MCEGIARAGNGVCLFASSIETMIGKCARLLRAGRKGVLEDVTLDWDFGTEQGQYSIASISLLVYQLNLDSSPLRTNSAANYALRSWISIQYLLNCAPPET